MKTDRELLAISRRMRSGEIALDDIGGLTREDLERMQRIGEDRLALQEEIFQVADQLMALLESYPEFQDVSDILVHYHSTEQREQYQALLDLLYRGLDLVEQEERWNELEA